jgi:hypothetical protein
MGVASEESASGSDGKVAGSPNSDKREFGVLDVMTSFPRTNVIPAQAGIQSSDGRQGS